MLISVTGYTTWWGKFGVDIASPSKKKKKKDIKPTWSYWDWQFKLISNFFFLFRAETEAGEKTQRLWVPVNQPHKGNLSLQVWIINGIWFN